MDIMNQITSMLISLPAILIALTFHEYAHGRVAHMLGDDTAYLQGRLTLNPLPHLDPVGFFALLFFNFGWAKPVQVNPYNFKNVTVKTGMMLVSLAGPGMNMLLAFLGLVAVRLISEMPGSEAVTIAIQLLEPLITINIILAAFNLIPLPPLDGSKILAGILPDAGTRLMYSLEQYGMVILLLLIVTGVASTIFHPIAQFLWDVMYGIVF